MVTIIELIGDNGFFKHYEVDKTEVNNTIIKEIDITYLAMNRRISFIDENDKIICQLIIPNNLLISVIYNR